MANYKSIYTGAEIDSAIGKANTALQEHQELKTINNESLVGEGNITIEGTSYTAGENIQISEENVISATNTIYDDTELREAIAGKQEELVSGTNIKTINGNSILGEGNLVVEGGSGGLTSVAHDATMTGAGTNENPLGVDTTKIAQKSDIPAEVTEATVSDWGFTKNTGTYSKPSGGIPKTDLASEIQTSLEKADTAIQDISNKQDTLVSGTNIKTINNTSILGSGNIDVGGGSSLPISFSTTQPPLDGSVILWINASAEEPSGDEITAQSVVGTFSSLEVEDMTEIVSRKYKVNATGTNTPYNCYIVKQGGLPINKIETASWSTTNFLIMGYNPTASAQTDLSVIIIYGLGVNNLGFELPVDGVQAHQQTTNPTVSGSFSDTSKAYIFESKAVGNDLVITATREDTGDLEVTYTFANKARKYVPCFGHGANSPGTINWEFKVVN